MDAALVSLATLGAVAGAGIGVGLGWSWVWGRRRSQRVAAELNDTRDRYTQALDQQHTQSEPFRALFDSAQSASSCRTSTAGYSGSIGTGGRRET